MDLHIAEETLKEYINKGVINEVIYASMAEALFKDIARHKDDIVKARLSTLFYQLQAQASAQQTLHLTRIFDKQPKKSTYLTHGISYVLDFIESYASLWVIRDRRYLLKKSIPSISSTMSDKEIVLEMVKYYRDTLPQKDGTDSLSMALRAMRESRDKVIAHNEDIPGDFIRTLPTWGNATLLTEYAKDFAVTILQVFTGLHFSDSSFNGTANIVVRNLRSLLSKAGIFPLPTPDEEPT